MLKRLPLRAQRRCLGGQTEAPAVDEQAAACASAESTVAMRDKQCRHYAAASRGMLGCKLGSCRPGVRSQALFARMASGILAYWTRRFSPWCRGRSYFLSAKLRLVKVGGRLSLSSSR
jgi:hypothetical protein